MFRFKVLISFIAFLQAFFTHSLYAASSAEESSVVTLNTDTFDKFISEHDLVMVEFFAPWCGHCQKLKPEYEKAAAILKEEGIPLVAIDATVETQLAERNSVKAYPTIYLFRKGVREDYKGRRTSEAIVSWVRSKTGPTLTDVDSIEAAKKIAKEESVTFIGLVKSKDSESYRVLDEVSKNMSSSGKFIAVIDPAANDTIYAIRASEGQTHLVRLVDIGAVKEFVKTEVFPLFGPINSGNYEDYFSSDRDMLWFIGTDEDYKKAGRAIRITSQRYRTKINSVWLDTAEYKQHAEDHLGIKKFPGLIYQTKETRFIYTKNDFENEAEISAFVEDVIDGKVQAHLVSEEIPEPSDEPVKVLVGKNLMEVGMQADKDVFVEVYAPWCGHCNQFEPIYQEFAEKMKAYPHVVVAKMDGTKNESPSKLFSWTGFPTVFFTKAGSDTPLVYDGPRTLEGLTDYLKQHGSKPLTEEQKDEL